MQNRIFILSLLFLFTFSISEKSFSQADTAKNSFQIGFVPQYIINHGVRIDFEPTFKQGKQSLQFSPQFYYDENNVYYSDYPSYYYSEQEYEKIVGYGAGLHHKIYIQFIKKWKIYVSYGGEYVRFTMDYKSWQWVDYTEEGLNYLSYELVDVKQNTDRIRADISMGVQLNYVDNLFLDFYIGDGGVYSLNDMNPTSAKPIINDGMYDYAYTGIYIPIGFRFGLRF